MKVTLLVENAYATGHQCSRTEVLDLAAGQLLPQDDDGLDEQALFEQTGCTCGEDVLPMAERKHSYYTVTITAAEDETLIGQTYEWD